MTIDGETSDGPVRAFYVKPGNALRLMALTIRNAVGERFGTTTYDGGAILNLGRLEVACCTFVRCGAGATYDQPTGYGGAIANGVDGVTGAQATVEYSTFENCHAARGGAIYNFPGNELSVEGCTFRSNRVGSEKESSILTAAGGALCNAKGGTLTYAHSDFSDNTAALDGTDTPSDYADLSQPYLTVRAAGGSFVVALNELALPELTGADVAVDLVSSGDTVSIRPGNVKPWLWYGLGHASTLGADFKVSTWVQADANGNLPQALTAPKSNGSGFYRIFASYTKQQP